MNLYNLMYIIIVQYKKKTIQVYVAKMRTTRIVTGTRRRTGVGLRPFHSKEKMF